MIDHPEIKLEITIEGDQLELFIRNTRPLLQYQATRQAGLGLKNVKKRLELLYPGQHVLNVISDPGSFSVLLKVSLNEYSISKTIAEELKLPQGYGMA